ncbi:acetyl-CoA carboxylase biotin carboxylase subunit [Calditerricola yamamurae]
MIIRKVLVANRGEIARRILRTCRARGVATVAVYSEADAGWPFVREADEAVLVGPPPVAQSYLNIEKIVSIAKETGADAIHPGYGFLSENPTFARRCREEGLVFIGPDPDVIAAMGDKVNARRQMQQAGVPVVPGTDAPLPSVEAALEAAAAIGYPVMLKASAGGGGIGMQVCRTPEELKAAYGTAAARARAYFGSGDLFLEKYIDEPRHIEVQILADAQGNVVHLFERDCSVQRRHQKVIEETPSPFLTEEARQAICAAAVTAAKAVGYVGAGTVEFIVDADQNFYFLEMNTRLQVEHPITEETLGLDLVALQLDIAEGKPLPFTQEDVTARRKGHAIECRVYAEDPVTFLPAPGRIVAYEPPGGAGVRIDDGVAAGLTVTPYYDPMIAKLIVSASTREEALARCRAALAAYRIEGIKHNIPFLQRVLDCEAFVQGRYTTHLVQELQPQEQKGARQP